MSGFGGWSAIPANGSALDDWKWRVRAEAQETTGHMWLYVTYVPTGMVTATFYRRGVALGSAMGRTQAEATEAVIRQQFLKDDPIAFKRGATGWVPKGGE